MTCSNELGLLAFIPYIGWYYYSFDDRSAAKAALAGRLGNQRLRSPVGIDKR